VLAESVTVQSGKTSQDALGIGLGPAVPVSLGLRHSWRNRSVIGWRFHYW